MYGAKKERLPSDKLSRRALMKRVLTVYDRAWIAHVRQSPGGHWTHAAAAGLLAVENAGVLPITTCGVEGGKGRFGVEYLYLNTGDTYDETLLAFKAGLRFGSWGSLHG